MVTVAYAPLVGGCETQEVSQVGCISLICLVLQGDSHQEEDV